MSFPALSEAIAKRQALAADLKSIFDEAGPDRDMSKVKSVPGGSEAVVAAIQEKNAALEELAVEIKKLDAIDKASKAADEYGEAEGEDTPTPDRKPMSLGEMFVASPAYKGFTGGQGPTATLGAKRDIRNTLFETGAGWEPESTRTGIVTLSAQRPAPHVVDFIPTLPTNQALVKFMRETTFTNNAAEAAEGAAYGEAALALTEASDEVEKVAVWLPVTDEQLEDEPAAAAYVDQRLTFMIRQRLDSQVLNGDGNTPNLLGTDALAALQTQALGSDPIPDAIYKLFTTIRSVGFAEPSVVFIEPDQWQNVRLLRTADGIYIWGSPQVAGVESIWGVPVVQTMACPANQVITGDYTNYSNLYIRRGMEVQITNSHDTFFINGKQAIRADLRVAMVHYRINAFGQVTGL
jgi:HK97 family phage major capsid protein